MKKELLIFGANGALGNGVTKVLLQKDFDNIHLFDFKFNSGKSHKNLNKIIVNDLSVENNVKGAFKNIISDKKKRFFLFSTVGGFHSGDKIWETKTDDFDKMMNINLKTNFLISKYFGKIVKDSAGGSICFTSAYTGSYQETEKGVYGASKAALSHLVKTLSDEGIKINLTANAVAPYIIDTPANRKWMKEKDYYKMIKPEEIGNFVWSIFQNFNYVSGNIFELKHRFSL